MKYLWILILVLILGSFAYSLYTDFTGTLFKSGTYRYYDLEPRLFDDY